jgi:hypothetical protein
MRERLVRYKYLTPFCRFVIVLASGTRIHVDAPGQLGRFDDQKVQYTDARGRWSWIAYRSIGAVEFKDGYWGVTEQKSHLSATKAQNRTKNTSFQRILGLSRACSSSAKVNLFTSPEVNIR